MEAKQPNRYNNGKTWKWLSIRKSLFSFLFINTLFIENAILNLKIFHLLLFSHIGKCLYFKGMLQENKRTSKSVKDKISIAKLGLVMFLLITATLVQSINFVSANPMLSLPVIRIMSDGSFDPSTVYPPTAPINITDNIYTVTRNITDYRLEILCNNITIDGAGYSLQGKTHFSGSGISINANGVTVKNINIYQFAEADIHVIGSSNTIVGNNLNGSILVAGDYNSIIKNTINTVHVSGYYNNLTENSINGYIYVLGSNNNLAENSIVNGGIYLQESSRFNTISENKITACVRGIRMLNSSYNIIHKNYIADCEYAVWLAGLPTLNPEIDASSRNNTFYHNNFVNNTFDVGVSDERFLELSDATRNYWDNGKEGNYWSNYNGTDKDNDGIGDKPYIINAKRQDNYPLMIPFNIENKTLQIPTSSPSISPSHTPNPTLSTSLSSSSSTITSPTLQPSSSTPIQQPTQLPEPKPTIQAEYAYTIIAIVATVTVLAIAIILKRK